MYFSCTLICMVLEWFGVNHWMGQIILTCMAVWCWFLWLRQCELDFFYFGVIYFVCNICLDVHSFAAVFETIMHLCMSWRYWQWFRKKKKKKIKCFRIGSNWRNFCR
jgi:hypothetical protein